MNVKKTISLLLALAMILSVVCLASCAQIGGDKNGTSGTSQPSESEKTDSFTENRDQETNDKNETANNNSQGEEEQNKPNDETDQTTRVEIETVEIPSVESVGEDVSYAKFIRIDSTDDHGAIFGDLIDNGVEGEENRLPVMLIESAEELDKLTSIIESNPGRFGWGIEEYRQAIHGIPNEFFATGSLFVAYVLEGSGSIRHELYSCDVVSGENGKECVVSVLTKKPYCCTDDLAGTLAIIAVAKETVEGCVNFRVERVRPTFTDVQADFAADLFKTVNAADSGSNILISPLSVTVALAMAANGATEFSETAYELYELLSEGMSRENFNTALASYFSGLPNKDGQKLSVANSIWYRDTDRMTIKDSFLQINRTYYGAEAYKEPFDNATVDAVNEWVKNVTDGMIDNVLQAPIDPEVMLYIINAICFDAKWSDPYTEYQVKDGIFTAQNGEVRDVKMMKSSEHFYIEDKYATGFVKTYEGTRYAFAALLPNENVTVDEYIASLDGRKLAYMIANSKRATVNATIPKFTAEYEIEMSPILKSMGLDCVFAGEYTDFGETAEMHDGTRLSVREVLHKTYVEITEAGTRAAAVTVVTDAAESMPPDEIKTVILDRPFVYAIVDTDTGLPIFIGTLKDITE